MKTLLKNGKIIDPVNGLNGNFDILLRGSKIIKIAEKIEAEDSEWKTIDLDNKLVMPGLIDMHTHLRDPGFEDKETIKTGCEAAAAGGFTTIACMPNTDPVADNPATVEYIKSKAEKAAVKVLPVGSITKKCEGKELAEIGFLSEEGVKCFSDDGNPVMNSEIMRRAMEYIGSFDLTVIDHCEDKKLAGEGVMNEGYISTILGLKPIPAAAEEIMIARDLILAELTGAKLHIAHLSTRQGMKLVTDAKERGIKVTVEVTPHHLVLTDEAVKGYNPDTKVNPPLRSREDVEALKEGLKQGIIDVIASDHAPHTFEDKLGEFDYALNGISGLETSLSLIHDRLIRAGVVSWEDIVRLMAFNPARVLGLKIEGIKEGAVADLTIFDPEREWTVKKENFKSKGKNTPFAGWNLTGKPVLTVVEGKIVYDDRGGNGELFY